MSKAARPPASEEASGEDDMERFEGTAATELVRGSVASATRVTAFLKAVYGWMCAGLAITALVAYSIASAPALVQVVVTNHLLFLALFVAQIALVFFLSARVDTLAPATATLSIGTYRLEYWNLEREPG